MSLTNELQKKIAADRQAGRDISPVIEELILMVAEKVEPPAAKKAALTKPTDTSK
ncbi:hypothetical protein R1521_32725 [Rhizobium brockwellii]|uniref:Uncharacterized protein n=1 Tax=Rhizobium brockwellii TaxID=3019932 RepID=A0ABU3YWU1_9HYPH|nr:MULTISPECIES: hypothetical protein [Rhizobium]MDV4183267.1 hypothetical protein [Rhizobium brockwellii]MDV4190278.1 hypothetical protein [Rhizobium brockwellii]